MISEISVWCEGQYQEHGDKYPLVSILSDENVHVSQYNFKKNNEDISSWIYSGRYVMRRALGVKVCQRYDKTDYYEGEWDHYGERSMNYVHSVPALEVWK